MSCPTCSATMSRLGCQYSECAGTWACPRCGTLKIGHEDGHFDTIVPALVERCREYEIFTLEIDRPGVCPFSDDWQMRGIAEAINKPEGRPR